MKKLLILTDWFAPAYKAGGPIRSCVNFSYAMSNDYNIYVITSNTDIGGEVLDVKSNQWIDYGKNIKVQYLDRENRTANRLLRLMKEVNPNMIYLNSMFSFYYSIVPLCLFFRKKVDSKIIIAPRGMLRESAIKYKSLKKKLYLKILYFSGVLNRLSFHATDEQEQPTEMKQYLVEATAFCLPSYHDAWAVVIHEAACAGLPIIATNVCGAVEAFVHDGYNGFLCEAKSKDSLKESLKKVMTLDEEQIKEFGNRSYALSKQLTPQLWANNIMRITNL